MPAGRVKAKGAQAKAYSQDTPAAGVERAKGTPCHGEESQIKRAKMGLIGDPREGSLTLPFSADSINWNPTE